MGLVKYDVPFAMADTISSLMINIFHDSKIANSYAADKTKTTCIVNGALKVYYKQVLAVTMALISNQSHG